MISSPLRPLPAPPRTQASSVLSLAGVGKIHWINGKPLEVLRDVALEVERGSFVSIVGPSGCGKSTLLRLIVGLDTDYSGSIRLDGEPIRGIGAGRGIAFQEHRLFPWLTVEQNIALGLDSSELSASERARSVADHIAMVGLAGFERAYPAQLSGGMSQRAAIARALVNRPSILLLDEPLGAVDSLTRAHLQNELLNIWRQEKVTVIMVTHDVEEAVYLSDTIVVMDARPGRIRTCVPISLPHPRERDAPDFTRTKDAITRQLG